MTKTELCGKATPNGKTCNMPAGHAANFHRHRNYKTPIDWVISDTNGLPIEKGISREKLGYAITRTLQNFESFDIRITQP